MPKSKVYPPEFRDDAVRLVRQRPAGTTVAEIAKGLGVSEGTLWKWLQRAQADQGSAHEAAAGNAAEVRELRRKNRLLEQENEVLRRAAAYFAAAHLPGK